MRLPTTEVEPRFKVSRERSAPHLAWLRKLPCCVPGCRQAPVEAHHVRKGAGVGLKPDDSACVPLCGGHHHQGHWGGWRTWEAKHGLDLGALAGRYAEASRALGILR
jgi:hypothetical protein